MNYILFNSDGSIKKTNFTEFIQQNSNEVNEIFVSVDGLNTSAHELEGVFVLPDGSFSIEAGEAQSDVEYEREDGPTADGYVLPLTQSETRLKGIVYLTLKVKRTSDQKVLYTYRVALTINESADLASVTLVNLAQYQALLDLISNISINTFDGEIECTIDYHGYVIPFENFPTSNGIYRLTYNEKVIGIVSTVLEGTYRINFAGFTGEVVFGGNSILANESDFTLSDHSYYKPQRISLEISTQGVGYKKIPANKLLNGFSFIGDSSAYSDGFISAKITTSSSSSVATFSGAYNGKPIYGENVDTTQDIVLDDYIVDDGFDGTLHVYFEAPPSNRGYIRNSDLPTESGIYKLNDAGSKAQGIIAIYYHSSFWDVTGLFRGKFFATTTYSSLDLEITDRSFVINGTIELLDNSGTKYISNSDAKKTGVYLLQESGANCGIIILKYNVSVSIDFSAIIYDTLYQGHVTAGSIINSTAPLEFDTYVFSRDWANNRFYVSGFTHELRAAELVIYKEDAGSGTTERIKIGPSDWALHIYKDRIIKEVDGATNTYNFDATDSGGSFIFATQEWVSGHYIPLTNTTNYTVNFNANGLTANRTYTLPDKSGTLATTDDITTIQNAVPYTGAVNNVNLGNFEITAKALKLTDGFSEFTSSYLDKGVYHLIILDSATYQQGYNDLGITNLDLAGASVVPVYKYVKSLHSGTETEYILKAEQGMFNRWSITIYRKRIGTDSSFVDVTSDTDIKLYYRKIS